MNKEKDSLLSEMAKVLIILFAVFLSAYVVYKSYDNATQTIEYCKEKGYDGFRAGSLVGDSDTVCVKESGFNTKTGEYEYTYGQIPEELR